ncbi:transglutaminase domain-containing protein [Sphaerisporangium sp. NPDC005288]|uniref:transglutaminase domain-containing protein n=1 Tax=Sphaerisporangium sp. NPDC005288 TaxID=3155114 RepID=UPI0033AA4FCB
MELSMVDMTTLMDRIHRIPDSLRNFTESTERVRRFYRIPDEVFDKFLELGLPHRPGPGGEAFLFDSMDLRNIVLILGVPSPQKTALKAMSRALIEGSHAQKIQRTVNVQGKCPDPGHDGSCEFELAAAVRNNHQVTAVRERAPHHFEIDLVLAAVGVEYLDFSAAHQKLVDELYRIAYHHIPFSLQTDLEFLAEAQIADCRLAAHFAEHRARELGIEVRGSSGLALSRPFSNRHFWTELKHGDKWVPIDPFYLKVLSRWGVLDETDWPPNRALLGALWRLEFDHPDDALVTHRGGCDSSYITR